MLCHGKNENACHTVLSSDLPRLLQAGQQLILESCHAYNIAGIIGWHACKGAGTTHKPQSEKSSC